MGIIEGFSFQAKNLSYEIINFLNEQNIDQIARETGFVQRKRKLSGFQFFDMLMFTHFNHKELSLNDLSAQLLLRYGIEISSQSIDERFTELAVVFFKTILKSFLRKAILQDQEQNINFTEYDRIRIKDSTSFQLPKEMEEKYKGSGGASSVACIRIQFEYDLKSGDILDLSLHPFNVQDTTNAGKTIDDINVNELAIRDLGYIKIGYLEKIQQKGAFYLNRLHSGTNAYEIKDGEYLKIDFGRLYNKMRKNKITCMEKEVYLGSKERFKTRMIIEVLPEDKYQERARKLKRKASKNSRNIGKEAKARMALNIFVTNTDIAIDKVRPLYALRWQIELMFKIWKTIGEIHKVKKMRIHRFEAYLFAKLIWIVIHWKLMWKIIAYYFNRHNFEISPYKLFKTFKNNLMDFRAAVYKGFGDLFNFIFKMADISYRNHKSEKKQKGGAWSYDIIRIFIRNKKPDIQVVTGLT